MQYLKGKKGNGKLFYSSIGIWGTNQGGGGGGGLCTFGIFLVNVPGFLFFSFLLFPFFFSGTYIHWTKIQHHDRGLITLCLDFSLFLFMKGGGGARK